MLGSSAFRYYGFSYWWIIRETQERQNVGGNNALVGVFCDIWLKMHVKLKFLIVGDSDQYNKDQYKY